MAGLSRVERCICAAISMVTYRNDESHASRPSSRISSRRPGLRTTWRNLLGRNDASLIKCNPAAIEYDFRHPWS